MPLPEKVAMAAGNFVKNVVSLRTLSNVQFVIIIVFPMIKVNVFASKSQLTQKVLVSVFLLF